MVEYAPRGFVELVDERFGEFLRGGVVLKFQEGTRAEFVAKVQERHIVGVRFHELLQVRHSLLGLAGFDEVIDCVPEFFGGGRCFPEDFGAGNLGVGLGRGDEYKCQAKDWRRANVQQRGSTHGFKSCRRFGVVDGDVHSKDLLRHELFIRLTTPNKPGGFAFDEDLGGAGPCVVVGRHHHPVGPCRKNGEQVAACQAGGRRRSLARKSPLSQTGPTTSQGSVPAMGASKSVGGAGRPFGTATGQIRWNDS